MRYLYYLVYRTTNKINGKEYIGIHKTFNMDDGYLGSGMLLQKAIKKYGKENFVKENIFIAFSEEDMYAVETEIVNQEYVDCTQTYNIRCGGLGGRLNTEARKRISLALSGRTLSEETCKKMSKARSGKKFSNVTRERMSERAKNQKPPSEETRKKMSASASKAKNKSHNTIWITNGKTSKRVNPNLSIPQGWYKGRPR